MQIVQKQTGHTNLGKSMLKIKLFLILRYSNMKIYRLKVGAMLFPLSRNSYMHQLVLILTDIFLCISKYMYKYIDIILGFCFVFPEWNNTICILFKLLSLNSIDRFLYCDIPYACNMLCALWLSKKRILVLHFSTWPQNSCRNPGLENSDLVFA